ncbi:MAG: hypothetical protein JSU61_08500 [Fidelibacterota bacterium]|nr:MAG: hypothetical protein JSU61_08500 [Candidatus Neomarinimicrobiota bacterium]
MEQKQPTYEFLYNNYEWPEPGTQRECPYSGIPLQLNEQRPGYNGKPWTCPQCIWYFSEEELNNPADFKDKDCPHTLEMKTQAAGKPEAEE